MRKTAAALSALALLAGLTACSSPDSVAGCAPAVDPGSASKVITATGAFDSAPTVSIPTPLYTKTTEKSTLIAGHGAPIAAGQPVILEATILNARTGAVLQQTSYTKAPSALLTAGDSTSPALGKALICAQIGSRIAIVGNAKQSHDGKADSTNDVRKDDSFVFVVDVRKAFPAKADGALQAPQLGLPSVVTTADGTPGITVPTTPAPKSLTTAVLRQGGGAVVKKGAELIVQYTGIGWDAKPTVFDSTWGASQAGVWQVGSDSLAPGLSTALAGKRIGSQLLVVVPAKLAAPADGSGTAPAGETVVYVVDILGIV